MSSNEQNTAVATREPADLRWLAAGVVLGLLATGYGLLDRDKQAGELPENVIARVNDVQIRSESFDRALERQQLDSTDPLSTEDRLWVLQRLIDEELLLQRGLALGMAESESEVRNAIVRSLIASVTAQADAADPSAEDLQAWFLQNPERFTYSSALAIDAWVSDDQNSAQAYAAALRSDTSAMAGDDLAPLPGLPSGLLPPEKLRDYVGPGISSAIERLPEGLVAVYARQGRWLVVRIVEKQESRVADIAAIRPQVLVEYRRELADQSLRSYLDDLRTQASVEVADIQ